MERQYSSLLLDKAVGEFAKLPGIGRKTALRLVLHLLRQDEAQTDSLAESLLHARHEIKRCS
ncbi:MAG: recombination protein RecR, partial [Prevotella sp.]|nr:recombination protein RecR [Prevotella sp.]